MSTKGPSTRREREVKLAPPEGFDFPDLRARSLQFHPEAGPGPHDLKALFEHFILLMVKRLQSQLKARQAQATPS